jgi:hypothetical protein
MSYVIHIKETFTDRAQAERHFDSLQKTAWPYVWCMEDVRTGNWLVRALIEPQTYKTVA